MTSRADRLSKSSAEALQCSLKIREHIYLINKELAKLRQLCGRGISSTAARELVSSLSSQSSQLLILSGLASVIVHSLVDELSSLAPTKACPKPKDLSSSRKKRTSTS